MREMSIPLYSGSLSHSLTPGTPYQSSLLQISYCLPEDYREKSLRNQIGGAAGTIPEVLSRVENLIPTVQPLPTFMQRLDLQNVITL
jgi:hypothetical protein